MYRICQSWLTLHHHQSRVQQEGLQYLENCLLGKSIVTSNLLTRPAIPALTGITLRTNNRKTMALHFIIWDRI